jgi:hypothetical protein
LEEAVELEDPVLALMKFGAAEHVSDLRVHGNLYMRTIASFRDLEADALRHDPHEGATRCWQPSEVSVQMKQADEWVGIEGIAGPIVYTDGSTGSGNMFCMFALRESHAEELFAGHSKQLVDVASLQFGDSALVLTDGDEFVRRVLAAAECEGLELHSGLVEYVNEDEYSGTLGPFRKFSRFAIQSEFRIVTRPEYRPVRMLTVGSLEDISVVWPLAELNGQIRAHRGEE